MKVKENSKTKSKKEKEIKILTTNEAAAELKISNTSLEELIKLYKLRSYTGYEEPVRRYILDILDKLNIPYVIYNGNIIGMNYNKVPLLSAHMDMVNTDWTILNKEVVNYKEVIDENFNIRMYKETSTKEAMQTSLGADDKNGIWLTLELLKQGVEINFIFSHGEEGGCVGINQVVANEEIAKDIENKTTYCLVLDRRNSGDIIGYDNDYCLGLDDKIEKYAKDNGYKFKKERGLCSDANHLSKLIECVNLSVGYYRAHSSEEFTNLKELCNTKDFVYKLINVLRYETVSPERMREFKKCSTPYQTRQKKDDIKTDKSNMIFDNRISSIYKTNFTSDLEDKKETKEKVLECALVPKADEAYYDTFDILDAGICPNCNEPVVVIPENIEKGISRVEYARAKEEGRVSYYCSCCGTTID